MSSITPQEIEQLKKQLKEKTEEIKAIYDKLIEAGVVPLPDDLLDEVAGGTWPTAQAIYSNFRQSIR